MFAVKIARFVIKQVTKSLAKEADKADTKRGNLSKLNDQETKMLDKRLKFLDKLKDSIRERSRASIAARDTEKRALEAKAWNNRATLEKLKKISL